MAGILFRSEKSPLNPKRAQNELKIKPDKKAKIEDNLENEIFVSFLFVLSPILNILHPCKMFDFNIQGPFIDHNNDLIYALQVIFFLLFGEI